MTLFMESITDPWVDEWPRFMPALELALLRRGVQDRDSAHERCRRCGRTPLLGERVYPVDDSGVICELCGVGEPQVRRQSRVVRGPDAGRTIRILETHAA